MTDTAAGRHRQPAPRRTVHRVALAAALSLATGAAAFAGGEYVRSSLAEPPPPAHVTGDAVATGPSQAPDGVAVDIWADYGCPDCEDVLAAIAGPLEHARAAGAATIRIHLSGSDDPSPRIVANTVACVADEHGPDRAADVWMSLVPYPQKTPIEGLVSESTNQMGLATPRLIECVTTGHFGAWLTQHSTLAGTLPRPVKLALNGKSASAADVAAALTHAAESETVEPTSAPDTPAPGATTT